MGAPEFYEITVESHVGSDWSYLFDDLTMRHKENGQTVLSGPRLDQAALQAVLGRILDLNLKLIAVSRVKPV